MKADDLRLKIEGHFAHGVDESVGQTFIRRSAARPSTLTAIAAMLARLQDG